MAGLVAAYKAWVAAHPGLVQDTEAALKWCSYLAAGYTNKSAVVSELLYTLGSLVTALHDRILANSLSALNTKQYSTIEHVLSVLETVEVFLELAAGRLGGPAARWIVIVAVQVARAVLRLVLLHRTGRLLLRPPVPPLDRGGGPPSPAPSPAQHSFKLPGSGRVIRSLAGSPASLAARDWSPPPPPEQGCGAGLDSRGRAGELLYTLQPLAHLAAMGVCGPASWTPFLLSLAVDCSSQALHWPASQASLDREEQQELARRRMALLAYLLRSPLYDKKSKAVIVWLLRFSQERIPLAGRLAGALLRYLPHYQQAYFYVWG